MELKIFEHFSSITEESWNSLLEQNEINTPFLRYGYQKSWWEFKGGGEWPENSELKLVTAYQGEDLIGIAPLFVPSGSDANRLLLLGSVEISDYLDLLCLPDHKEEFIEQLLHLIHKEMKNIGSIDWINIPERSSTIRLISKLAEKCGWKVEVENAYHTPAIKLAADWETYLAGIDKKQRHEIRRKMRRADENSDNMKWYIVSEKENLNSEIQAFFSLMEMDSDKEKFLTERMRAQMTDIIHWAFDEGILQLSFLQIDQGKASAYLCFDYGGHLLVYNSGFDFDYSEYSPGWVLLSYLIKHAIETGRTNFDFMRGDETYKYRFGAEDGFVMRARLTRS